MPVFANNVAGDKSDVRVVATQWGLDKSVKEDVHAVLSVDGEAVNQVSNATSSSSEFNYRDVKSTPDNIHTADSQSSDSFTMVESPIERSNLRIPLTTPLFPVCIDILVAGYKSQ
ncbi:protein SPIRRIG-like [Forsythia ovata]|uniref:Protein SPIRRIG-like n=1 Tax=Forsythia ovata TaxID=205694 RepID=A0ABD1X4A0_9LAMI